MARYWRLVNLLTYSGHLSLSDVQLYDGATKIPTTASATVPPSIGTLGLLDDGLSDEAVTWLRCSDPGFAVVLDAGTSYDAVSLRLGSGASAADYPRDVTLQTSADLINWTTHVSYVHVTWPGAFSLAPAIVSGGDPDYSKVSLLLAGNGVNGSTVFIDASPTQKSITPYGNAQISTAQSKFGSSSMYFDGAGDYLAVPTSTDFAYGLGDFTIEAFVYPTASAIQCILGTGHGGTTNPYFYLHGLTPTLFYNSTAVCAGAALTLGTWSHLAVTRSATGLKIYTNGIGGADGAYLDNLTAHGPILVGVNSMGGQSFTGYINDLRVTKGVARYTDDFTPPSMAFPATSGGWVAVDTPTPSRLRLSAPAPQLYVPTIALTGGAVQLGLGGQTFVDVYNGGIGTITGTVKEKNTPANTPLRRRVLLIDEASRMTIRETWSDPETGAFEFRGIKQGVKYSTISYDHLHNYRAVIADNQDAS